MGRKSRATKTARTTYRDLLRHALELEMGTKAGNINLRLSVLLVILIGIIAVPSVVETIANLTLSLNDKAKLGVISDTAVTVLVIGTAATIIFCLAFLVYANSKASKS